jgi:peptide/nickel transport system substrate-binding protein
VVAGALVAFVAVGGAGCGGDEDPGGGTATVLMTSGPDYLDPQLAYTTKAAEADWIAYTPLLTYRHEGGSDGAKLIPGLAESLPRISADGRRYQLTLRDHRSTRTASRSWRAISFPRSSARSGSAGAAGGS